MKLSEIIEACKFTAVHDEYDDHDVGDAYTSDLLSDVMAHAPDGSVLITIQAHKNTVAVAALAGVVAIVICNARPIPDDMIVAARDERIALLTTGENQYTVSGRIYTLLAE